MNKIYFINIHFNQGKNKFQKMIYESFKTLVNKTISKENIPAIRIMYDEIVDKYLSEKGSAKIDKYYENESSYKGGDIDISVGEIIHISLILIKGEIK